VSDIALDCIGFIYETALRDEFGPKGDALATGFLASVPSSVRGRYLYFVTAAHVVKDLADKESHFLVNKPGGGTVELWGTEDPPRWYLHPHDNTCDIAVVPVLPNSSVKVQHVPIEHMLTDDEIRKQKIGIGDEVYSVGLFTEVDNTSKNWPILRHGNIAMMPTEQIQTDFGYADVYLIEARSIGGMSGSPVFVRPSGKIVLPNASDGSRGELMAVQDCSKLLGIVHGHWDVRESDINRYPIEHDRKRGVNYGIAIVVPAFKLIETLKRPELEERRMKHDEMLKKKGVPGMDSRDKKEQQEQTFTQEDFEDALKKASRKKQSHE
jgi:Trypsin-like peptidase domain